MLFYLLKMGHNMGGGGWTRSMGVDKGFFQRGEGNFTSAKKVLPHPDLGGDEFGNAIFWHMMIFTQFLMHF